MLKSAGLWALTLAFSVSLAIFGQDQTDQQIRRKLVQQSIAGYSGSCPCPESRDRAGRRCGKRSAYSRPGGASPLCYERDVTDAMVARYREQQSKQKDRR